MLSVKHIKVIMIGRVAEGGGADDDDNDDDDSYFCVLRGSCGGAQATAPALIRMCRSGDRTLTRRSRSLKVDNHTRGIVY